jgi:hypothetical protein
LAIILIHFLMPAQLMFGKSDVNARGAGLPLAALRSLARQASIDRSNVPSPFYQSRVSCTEWPPNGPFQAKHPHLGRHDVLS